ncbi:MAG: hypothetical protein ABSA79_11945 [Candidatus Bathyarchaeia archaeon]|jgi:hypothetical protein
MKAKIAKDKSLKEYSTSERCFVVENYSDELVSIARARVKPGVTTTVMEKRLKQSCGNFFCDIFRLLQ